MVFISHSEGDKKHYFVEELKKKLKEQKEIRKVYGSGEETISESQLLLFIATKHSLTNDQCLRELSLAKKNHIGIIPIIGTDSDFNDLGQIDLGEDYLLKDKFGLAFDDKHFEQFCNDLYEHIRKYKRKFNVFEPEDRKVDDLWENIKFHSEKFVESEEFREIFIANNKHFKKLFATLENGEILPFEYIYRTGQLFKLK